jgi:hypothetical protein
VDTEKNHEKLRLSDLRESTQAQDLSNMKQEPLSLDSSVFRVPKDYEIPTSAPILLIEAPFVMHHKEA